MRSVGSASSRATLSVRGSTVPRRRVVHEGHVAPPALGGDPRAQPGTPPALGGPTVQRGQHRVGDQRHVADHTAVDHPVDTDRVAVDVDLRDGGAGRDQPAVPRGPHVQRAAPGHHEVGAGDELGRQRRREAARDVEVPRVAGEEPLRGGGDGEQRPAAVGEPGQRRPGQRRLPGRAAAGDEHRSGGRAQRRGEPRDVGVVRRAGSAAPGRSAPARSASACSASARSAGCGPAAARRVRRPGPARPGAAPAPPCVRSPPRVPPPTCRRRRSPRGPGGTARRGRPPRPAGR